MTFKPKGSNYCWLKICFALLLILAKMSTFHPSPYQKCEKFELAYSNLPTQSSIKWCRWLRIVSSQVLNLFKDGDFPNSPGNLFQCLATLIKLAFSNVKWNICTHCLLPFHSPNSLWNIQDMFTFLLAGKFKFCIIIFFWQICASSYSHILVSAGLLHTHCCVGSSETLQMQVTWHILSIFSSVGITK